MLKELFLSCFSVLFSIVSLAQTGEISGYITNQEGDTLGGAFVSVFKNDEQIFGTYSEFDGRYMVVGLNPGKYDVAVEELNHQKKRVNGVIVGTNQKVKLNFVMQTTAQAVDVVEIITYKKPLVDKDKQATIYTAEEIEDLAVRDVAQIAATSVDVITQPDGSGELNVRGQRAEGTQFIVDGVKINGSISIPQNAIEQVEVISGGLPAMYGDNVGGVVVVTTKGVSPVYYGGVEAVSSEMLDGFGYNLVTGSFSGPLLKPKRDEEGTIIKKSPLGFLLTGEYLHQDDPRPSPLGSWSIKPEVLEYLENNPLRAGLNGSGTMRNSEFVTADDFVQNKIAENVQYDRASATLKLDFQPSDNFTITAGAIGTYRKDHQYIYEYSLFNPSNNPERTFLKYNAFLRLKHRIRTDSSSWLKNFYYQIQGDYMYSKETVWDDSHKDNFFSYGHVGQFRTTRSPLYEYEMGGDEGDAYYYKGEQTVLYELLAPGSNPNASKYAQQYYDIYAGQIEGNYENWNQVQNGGALLNGDRPEHVYGLWFNTGRQYNSYQLKENDQLRINGNVSGLIFDNHQINIGFEHEIRTRRHYSLNPIGLWTIMRQLANSKNTQLDLDNPDLVYSNGVFQDTVNYSYMYQNDGTGKGFYENVRDQFGIGYDEYFDSDYYLPGEYSLDLFTADELYQEGNGVLDTYGYDYKGNKIKKKGLADFFSSKKNDGSYLRYVSPFNPIYSSAYIQDKFEFKDIIFNIGLRVDRYDANQPVMKDPYSLYDTYKAGELGASYTVPSNISDDAVVYVKDFNATTPTVLGYREGSTWYDANGVELTDASSIAEGSATGEITPYLRDPNADIQSADFDPNTSFEDYTPQISFMPRFSMTFNLSDNASFFAHYDVLTQRPQANLSYFLPNEYLFMESNVGRLINNPNLKPQKTIDYEVGFQQALNDKSAVTFSAFYREMENMFQLVNINYAYPANYITYDNIDRASIKGFSFKYDLRPIHSNFGITAGYTLQFAEGTGSSERAGANLISAGFPNLKVFVPLDFDQRHTFKTIFNYKFKPGKKYIGPDWNGWGRKILGGFGFNLVGNLSSGRPYTGQVNYTQEGAISGADQGKAIIDGDINGNRLPWLYTIDLRVSRKFVFGFENEARDQFHSEIYVAVTNLLNTNNIIKIYQATGNAEDDGYLDAATSQAAIMSTVNPQSFNDLYSLKILNPSFYALPRMIRLGATLNF